MKLLLQKKVQGLGDVGDVVEISDEYGRNYLIPQRVAVPNTPENRQRIQADRLRHVQLEAERVELAKVAGKTLKNALLQVVVKAQKDGTLYGSVNTAAVVKAIEANKSITIDERWVQLEDPIKKIGDYDITLKLPGDAEVTFKLTVLPED